MDKFKNEILETVKENGFTNKSLVLTIIRSQNKVYIENRTFINDNVEVKTIEVTMSNLKMRHLASTYFRNKREDLQGLHIRVTDDTVYILTEGIYGSNSPVGVLIYEIPTLYKLCTDIVKNHIIKILGITLNKTGDKLILPDYDNMELDIPQ